MAEISSLVWGGKPYPITQGFGIYNPELADWYEYAKYYGYKAGTHIALDVAMPKLTPIYAAQDGTVKEAGWSDSFRPNPVTITEVDGDEAIYGHLWSAAVSQGQRVKRGDLVGYSGEQTVAGTMTPDGSGPHIHFELRRPDPLTGGFIAVDPTPELTGAPDDNDPRNQYGKSPYDQYSWSLPSGEDVKAAGQRVALGAAGIVAALLGAWVLLGAPTSVAGLAASVAKKG